jgi:chromosome segregation ATPase
MSELSDIKEDLHQLEKRVAAVEGTQAILVTTVAEVKTICTDTNKMLASGYAKQEVQAEKIINLKEDIDRAHGKIRTIEERVHTINLKMAFYMGIGAVIVWAAGKIF